MKFTIGNLPFDFFLSTVLNTLKQSVVYRFKKEKNYTFLVGIKLQFILFSIYIKFTIINYNTRVRLLSHLFATQSFMLRVEQSSGNGQKKTVTVEDILKYRTIEKMSSMLRDVSPRSKYIFQQEFSSMYTARREFISAVES